MQIGVIGAGRIGGTLARLFAKAGHEVAIANSRGPQTLAELDNRYDGRIHAVTSPDAAQFGDVVVVAIPFGRFTDLPVAQLAGKTVIDTGNYYPARDGHIPVLDRDQTTSTELVQSTLRGARLVKAFNTMRWDHLRDYGRQSSAQLRYAIPVSGNDPAAKRQVFDLVEQLGFEPVDMGGLAGGGRRQQPGSSIFGMAVTADQLKTSLVNVAH